MDAAAGWGLQVDPTPEAMMRLCGTFKSSGNNFAAKPYMSQV
jgi:hypothetical protein